MKNMSSIVSENFYEEHADLMKELSDRVDWVDLQSQIIKTFEIGYDSVGEAKFYCRMARPGLRDSHENFMGPFSTYREAAKKLIQFFSMKKPA